MRAEVISIIRDRYSDFGPTLAAEKPAELHGIHLAREILRQWMMVAGLWKDRRARMRRISRGIAASAGLAFPPKSCSGTRPRWSLASVRWR